MRTLLRLPIALAIGLGVGLGPIPVEAAGVASPPSAAMLSLAPMSTPPLAPWGTVLVSGSDWAGSWASKGDLNVYSNGDGNEDVLMRSGLAYECVELAQRWATVRFGAPDKWYVNADGMWDRGPQLPIPFRQLPNGGAVGPQFGDLVVYGPGNVSAFGHVAVVTAVRPGSVDLVEQNWNSHYGGGRATVPIYGTYMAPRSGLPVYGWLRSSLELTGYWMLGADGGIFPFGTAGGYGSTGGMHLNKPIVAMAPTHSGKGYWLVASDGGIFPFGDAGQHSYGSTGGIRLNRPIVGMAPTPSGNGYYLVASDGGIFPFGDALKHSYGSTGNIVLNQPIIGMTVSSSGNGYYLVASDGGVFPFGDALQHSYGSTGGRSLSAPVVGMAPTNDNNGYWLVGSDGAVYAFGDAEPVGSLAGSWLAAPIIGIAAAPVPSLTQNVRH